MLPVSFCVSVTDQTCRKTLAAVERREVEDRALKRRRLLMDEFKCGIWTAQQYRKKVEALEASENDADKENSEPSTSSDPLSPFSTPTPAPAQSSRLRTPSPPWDIEDDDASLCSDDDMYA